MREGYIHTHTYTRSHGLHPHAYHAPYSTPTSDIQDGFRRGGEKGSEILELLFPDGILNQESLIWAREGGRG